MKKLKLLVVLLLFSTAIHAQWIPGGTLQTQTVGGQKQVRVVWGSNIYNFVDSIGAVKALASSNASAISKKADSARVYSALDKKTPYIADISALLSYVRGNNTTVIVNDPTRGGTFKWLPTGTADGGLIFPAVGGGYWNRVYDGVTVFADWYGLAGDGVTDETTLLQKAINGASTKTLKFTQGKTYRWVAVFLPLNEKLDFTGAIVKPYKTGSGNNDGMLQYNNDRVNPATGTASDGAFGNFTGETANTKKVVKLIEIYGATVDLEFSRMPFFSVSLYRDFNNIDVLSFHDNTVINYFRAALVVNNRKITGTNPVISECRFFNNNFKDGGYFMQVATTQAYTAGATNIQVQTIDKSPIANKIAAGKTILFSTSNADIEGGTTFNTTNAIYRVSSIVLDANDPSKAIININSGDYSTAGGFVQHNSNLGLKVSIPANSTIIPPTSFEFSSLLQLPQYTGTIGSTTLTRSDLSSPFDNAYAGNLYTGLKFNVNNHNGVYTIVSVNNDNTLTITPALAENTTSTQLNPLGTPGNAIELQGDNRLINVYNNKSVGGEHFLGVSGAGGPGLLISDLKSRVNIENNETMFHWMHIETSNGGPDNRQPLPALLSGLTITAGSTTFTPPNPTNYKVMQYDLNGDGTNETLLTLTGTTVPTLDNSLVVGDVLSIMSVAGRYSITNLPSDWSTNPVITISRYDIDNRLLVAGGTANGLTNANATDGILYQRVYAPLQGTYGYNYLKLNGNKMSYSFSGGFLASLTTGNELIITNNDFYQSEQVSLELYSNKALIDNNRFTNIIFNGSIPVPSATTTGTGPSGRSVNALAFIGVSDLAFTNNIVKYTQPTSAGFNQRAGNIVLGTSFFYENRRFILSRNLINGLPGKVLGANNNKIISGNPYGTIYWNYQEISDNSITLTTASENSGIFEAPYGLKTTIKNNNITAFNSNPLSLYDRGLNTDYFPTPSTLDITFTGNTISSPGTITYGVNGASTIQGNSKFYDKPLTTLPTVNTTAPLSGGGTGNITLSIATASGTQTGALSATDYTTFNNKVGTLAGETLAAVTARGASTTTPLALGASSFNGNITQPFEDVSYSVGGNRDIGFVKKTGLPGMAAIGATSSGFIIAKSSANNIDATNTFTTLFTLDPNGALSVIKSIKAGGDDSFIGGMTSDNLALVKKSGQPETVYAAGSATPHRWGNWSTNQISANVSSGTFTEKMRLSPAGLLGINTITPTAYADLPASTTATASFRIRSGIAPSVPNDGELWYVANRLHHYANGVDNIVAYSGDLANYVTTNTNQLTGLTGQKTWDGQHIFNVRTYFGTSNIISIGNGQIYFGNTAAGNQMTLRVPTAMPAGRDLVLPYSNASSTDTLALKSDVTTTARKRDFLDSNKPLVLNGDFLSTTSTKFSGTLPPTTGWLSDGSKIITVMSIASGGARILVPSGYTLRGTSGIVAGSGTNGIDIVQDGKVQIIPIGTNIYEYQMINGSATIVP